MVSGCWRWPIRHIENKKNIYSKEDENDLILKGYAAFLDPPKPSTKRAILALKKLGVGS